MILDGREVALFAVRSVHAAYVAWLILGPGLRWRGAATGHPVLTNPWFGRLHAAGLGLVALQVVLRWPCPLTVLENRLAGLPDDTPFLPIPSVGPAAVAAWLGFLTLMLAANLSAGLAGEPGPRDRRSLHAVEDRAAADRARAAHQLGP